jgi:hypothetical protein
VDAAQGKTHLRICVVLVDKQIEIDGWRVGEENGLLTVYTCRSKQC